MSVPSGLSVFAIRVGVGGDAAVMRLIGIPTALHFMFVAMARH